MYRYSPVSPPDGKCIHLTVSYVSRYIEIHHMYTSMKPNKTAIHQMYRDSIQLYICHQVVTALRIAIQRYSTIQRYSDTPRYNVSDVSPPLRRVQYTVHVYIMKNIFTPIGTRSTRGWRKEDISYSQYLYTVSGNTGALYRRCYAVGCERQIDVIRRYAD